MEKRSSSSEMVEPESEGHEEVDEEDYVLLDLSSITNHITIPQNAPYVLSGLDTVNPVLMIDNKIKLIGEYQETIGTCLVFSENDEDPNVHEETGSSEAKRTPTKQINPMAQLNKVLKFRLCLESSEDGRDKQAEKAS